MKKEILIGMLLLISAMGVVSASGPEYVKVVAPNEEMNVGDTFNVTIEMFDGGQNASAWVLYEFTFNPSKLRVVNMEIPPDFWKTTFSDVGGFNNTNGKIFDSQAFKMNGTGGGITTDLLNITFQVLSSGTCNLELTDFKAKNSETEFLDFIVSNAVVNIAESGNGGDDDDGTPPPPPPPPIDSDGDGVPDSEDVCPGHDDTIDSDGDGIPDGCDDTPYGDNDDDDDNDEEPGILVADAGGPYFADVGEIINFDGTGSFGNIVLWNWDFGDGNGTMHYDSVQHVYNRGGNYTIALAVGDDYGNVDVDMTYALIIEEYIPEEPEPEDGKGINGGEGFNLSYIGLIAVVVGFILIVYFLNKRRREYE